MASALVSLIQHAFSRAQESLHPAIFSGVVQRVHTRSRDVTSRIAFPGDWDFRMPAGHIVSDGPCKRLRVLHINDTSRTGGQEERSPQYQRRLEGQAGGRQHARGGHQVGRMMDRIKSLGRICHQRLRTCRKQRTILIDCGKSFLTSALEWFPKKGFRKIDALVGGLASADNESGLHTDSVLSRSSRIRIGRQSRGAAICARAARHADIVARTRPVLHAAMQCPDWTTCGVRHCLLQSVTKPKLTSTRIQAGLLAARYRTRWTSTRRRARSKSLKG